MFSTERLPTSSATTMVCFRKMTVKLNSLESIWYCVFTLVVTTCLCFDGIRHHQHYNNLDWPEGKPKAELDLHVLCTLSAFLIILLFVPTQIFQVGNRANDQGKLGFLKDWEDDVNRDCDEGSQSERQIRRIRKYILAVRKVTKHLGPVGATLHIISAFCLLMPLMFLQARAIQYGLLSSGSIWRAEVSVVSTFYAQQMIAPEEENHSEAILPSPRTPSMIQPNEAPPNKYFPEGEGPSESVPIQDPFKVYMVTLNYINYVIPLFLYAIRYADVFWLCHKGFAFFFCAQLMLNATQYALGFIGISLLYKIHWYGWDKYGVPREPVFFKPTGLIGCYLTNNITVFLSAVVTYTYGYGRLKQAEQRMKGSGSVEIDDEICSSTFAMKCNGFVSHIGALLVLLIFICCKTPLVVEYFAVFQISKDARLLGIMVFDIIYVISWLLLWIGFGIKRKWDFKIHQPAPDLKNQPNCDPNGWNNRLITQPTIPLQDLDMDGFPGPKRDTLESMLRSNHSQGSLDDDMEIGGDLSKSHGQYEQLRSDSSDPESPSMPDCPILKADTYNEPAITSTPKSSISRKRNSFGCKPSPGTPKQRSLSITYGAKTDHESSSSGHSFLAKFKGDGSGSKGDHEGSSSSGHHSFLAKFKGGEEEDLKSGRSPPEASPLLNQDSDRQSLDLDRC